jgi:hypothetical protein
MIVIKRKGLAGHIARLIFTHSSTIAAVLVDSFGDSFCLVRNFFVPYGPAYRTVTYTE